MTLTVAGLEGLEKWLLPLQEQFSWDVELGWLEGTDPEVLKRAYYMEYRHEKEGAYLPWAILRKTRLSMVESLSELVAALSLHGFAGEQLWEAVADYYKNLLLVNLLEVTVPDLAAETVRRKARMQAQGKLASGFLPDKIWVETGETLAAIDSKVTSVGG